MFLKKIHAFVILICLSNLLSAQHPAYYKITDEAGLPSNEIYKIIQDDFGYIWIGCDAGLYRYDGFTFKSYTNSQQNGKAISFLQIDVKQRIWCKNFYGQIYRVDGDSLRVIKNIKTSNPSFPQFTIDNDCNLWLYNKNYIIKNNEFGDSISSYKLNLNVNEEIISLKFFNNQIYAFSSMINITTLNVNTLNSKIINWKFKPTNNSKNSSFIEHKGQLMLNVSAMTNSSDCNSIYSITDDSITEFYRFKGLEKNNIIYSIYSDSKDLWATTSFGAFKINTKNNSTCKILFKDEKISSLLKDREGMYWFSSLHNGLFISPNMNVNTINSTNSFLKENAISSVKVVSEHKLLIGTYLGNIFEYDLNSELLNQKYLNDNEKFISVKQIKQNNKYTIISRGRFCIIDNIKGTQFFPKTYGVRDFELVEDTLYLVLTESVQKIAINDLLKKDFKTITINEFGGRSIEYDPKTKSLYFAMGNGTYIYHNCMWTELKIANKPLLINSLSYANDIIWASSVSSGIYGFNGGQVKYHYDTKNYLSENSTRVIKAELNTIWFTTDDFLYLINYKTNTVNKFDKTSSINPKEINNIEVYHDTVYLATNKGVIFFPANLKWKNSSIPNLIITGVFINNELSVDNDELKLKHNNKNIKICFSSVALKSKGNFLYQYRLFGLDSNWTNVSPTTPFVLFAQIPSGNFNFELRSINEHGIFSKTIRFGVFVETPFWQRWWFYLLLIIVVAGILTALFMTRIRFIKRRAELRNKVTASQLTALKSQMNPHFLFNTLNSLQDLILKQDIKNSNFYLNKFSLLMREILDVSGKDEINLSREIKLLDTYLELEKMRFGDDFIFSIHIADEIDSDHLLLPPMILQPFIENALKHGLLHKKGDKNLLIEFKLVQDILICEITDNGVGRKRSEEIKTRNSRTHQSFATEATDKRMDLLNSFNDKKYSFKIIDLLEDDRSLGTKVIISIPI